MRSVAVLKPGELGIVEVPKPEPGPYEVLVRSECSFICNATDRKIIEGHFPGIGPEAYPVLLGHETVGIVEAAGAKVKNFSVGSRAVGGLLLDTTDRKYGSAWGGNSDYVLIRDYHAEVEDNGGKVPADLDDVYRIMLPVPDDISPEDAALLCTWREVYGGFSDFRLRGDEKIVIFGAGPVGLSFVRFAKIMGFPLIVSVDPLPAKRELALKMGADAVYSPGDGIEEEVAELTGGKADAVIDAVGNEGIINRALGLVRLGGSVCVYGVLAKDTITLNKAAGPFNFNLYMHQWPTREAEAAAQEPLCRWIREGQLGWKPFVTGVFPLEKFSEAYTATSADDAVKTMIRYES